MCRRQKNKKPGIIRRNFKDGVRISWLYYFLEKVSEGSADEERKSTIKG